MKHIRPIIFIVLTLLVFIPQVGLGVQLGQDMASFTGKDTEGNLIDMDKIIGKKPVMLVFWASWCPSCRVEAPAINKLVKEFRGQGMEFVGVNIGHNDSIRRAPSFIKKLDMNYPTIFDAKGKISSKYRIQGVPTIIVADNKGTILFRNHGTPDITEENFNMLNGK